MYPQEIVIPMKEELTERGFDELLTTAEVESALQQEGTTLVMINSVCGLFCRQCPSGCINGGSQ
jgi:putative YphP/YqiW family bacilliredoxin